MGRGTDAILMSMRHADPHPARLVHDALVAAGLTEGRFASRGLRGEYFDPAVPGFLVRFEQSWRWAARERKRTGDLFVVGYRIHVDHAGPKRNAAVAKYLAALRAAGLRASIGPLIRGIYRPGKRQKYVVYLSGIYDHRGFLVAGEQSRAERRPTP